MFGLFETKFQKRLKNSLCLKSLVVEIFTVFEVQILQSLMRRQKNIRNIKAMNILSECKTILTYAGLTETKHIEIAGRMINRTLIRMTMICLLFTALVIEFIVCLKGRHKSVDNVLLPLHLGLSCLASLFIYVRLMMKADKIHELIEYLEDVVNKRNFWWIFDWTVGYCW